MKKKVLLLSMPFGALGRPALGLSLLKAELARRSIPCDVHYLAFLFAEFMGGDEYQWISNELPYTAFAGDWAFTSALYQGHSPAEERYVQEVLRDQWQLHDDQIRRIWRARCLVQPFLDQCMQLLPWRDYSVVGFTSTFEQNIASLALARLIKEAHPSISIVLGGANWEGEMGIQLHQSFPFVDYVCSGEAENSFPALVQLIENGASTEVQHVKGLVYRSEGESISTGPPEMIRQMDELPLPDFSDYFRDLNQSTVSAEIVPTLLFESSRGCWWGARSHCTFCGLNGGSMAFRSKSPKRALDELETLVEQWRTDLVEAVDNILDMNYFNDMLPALARSGRGVRLFYEVKANLTRRQIELLRDAGVHRIQPGIESMSDHVLKLMRKGTTALRNIQLLKWCREYTVATDWNILYGFPGETAQDYADQLELLKAIRFLDPPCACGPIRLDRFSPYFNAPADFGLVNVRPMTPYRYLYPLLDETSLRRVAYYFDFDYEAAVDPRGYATEVIEFAESWKREPEIGTLRASVNADRATVLTDTRAAATSSEFVFEGYEQAAYDFCDEIRSITSVGQHLSELFPESRIDQRSIKAFLDSLVANRLMVTDGDHYLNLALRARPRVQKLAPLRTLGSTSGAQARPASSYLKPKLEVLQGI